MNNKRSTFEFHYSAPTDAERREIESIRRRYSEADASPEYKLARLRLLDARVRSLATALSLIAGILGALIFGLGIAMILEWNLLGAGILVASLGILPILAAYPLYGRAIAYGKKKYSAEILRLSEELLGGEPLTKS